MAPAEYYYNCSSFGPTVLAVYNAGNGALTTWSDISADLHEASSVAVVPEKDQVVVSSFCDAYQGFTTLWVYNLNTLLNNPPGGVLTATTTIRMSIPVQFIQGISWNSTIGQFLASTVGGVAGNLWYIAPDGGVTGPAYVVPGTQSAELEGLDFTTDNVYYLENGYVTNIGAPVAAPSFSVSSGTYTSPQTVTISDANAAAAIHYTIDGSMPTAASPVYSAPIPIATTKTLKAIATVSGSVNSPMTVATFTIN